MKLSVTETDFVVVEDTRLLSSNAVVLKVRTVQLTVLELVKDKFATSLIRTITFIVAGVHLILTTFQFIGLSFTLSFPYFDNFAKESKYSTIRSCDDFSICVHSSITLPHTQSLPTQSPL